MADLVFLVMLLTMIGGSDGSWCICNPNQSTALLQKTLDYACGAGANCSPINQSGACYNPNTVVAHCSYAVNSYYQINNQTQGSCDFSGTATVTTTDPSTGGGCTYPSTASGAGSSPTTNTPPGSPLTPGSTPPTGAGAGTGTGTGTGGGIIGLG